MTRVAVNMLWCVPGQVGGSEQYLVRQLLGLCEAAPSEFEVEIVAPRGFVAAHPELTHPELTDIAHPSIATNLRVIESSSSASSRPLRILREATWLAKHTRGAALTHHGGGTVPPRATQPTLLTLHDLQFREFPQHFSRTKLRYLAARVPLSAQRASHIAVPSSFVKQTVIDHLGVAAHRISVVRHGVESSLGGRATSADELRRRFGITAARVLAYPAITHPHKNHQFLLDLARHGRLGDTQIVFAGGEGRAHRDVLSAIATYGLARQVIVAGRLGDADRDGLLALADALVFPSTYEGFGAPVIEAMALGTPVITSDHGALPEVVGDAGQVVSLDLDAWSHAIDRAISQRADWQSRGRRRAGEFRSVDSGRDLAAVYRAMTTGATRG